MRFRKTVTAVALTAALAAFGSHAQAPSQNLEKLKQMKVATTDLNIPVVPQSGRNADAIRENLKRIKLPPGFKIELFAIVPMRATWRWRRAPTCCSSARGRRRSGQ
jgi:hypothetical protein